MLRFSLFIIYSCLSTLLLAQHDHSHLLENKDYPSGHLTMQQRAVEASMDNYDLKYHFFDWFIDPDTLYIEGKVTSYFVPKTTDFNKMVFELSRYLLVDSIIYNGQRLQYTHETAYFLEIDLPFVLQMGKLDSIKVYYHGGPEQNGSGSFVKDYHDTASVIWTLSEPYGSRDWWPCKHVLNDKIDSIDVYVKTTAGNRVASNGVLVADSTAGQFAYFHWKHRYPIAAYLIAVAVTNYESLSFWVTEGADSLEILNYVYPEDVTNFYTDIAQTVPIMELFIEKYGAYPFEKEKYGHAQFGRNGGMEHQTMSFMGHFSGGLVAHELAHQWFGNKVTCQSWSEIWVNESFATFSDAMYYEYFRDYDDFIDLKKDRIRSITHYDGGSIYVYGNDTNSVSRVFSYRLSYQKGSMVLYMLRLKLGDSLFFKSIQSFLQDPDLAYDYASTEDIRYHFEQVSGMDLKEFFDDWIYGQGYPSYTVHVYPVKQHVSVVINQDQSHSSADFFELPVPIRFVGPYGKTKTIVFDHSYDGQLFEVDLGFEPDSFVFDPEYNLISKNNKMEIHNLAIDEDKYALLFPNPVEDQLYIQFMNYDVVKRIRIYNQLGQLMREEYFDDLEVSPGMKISRDVSDLFDGMYSVVIDFENIRVVHKMIKP
jgi:aminopeptidase N